MIRVLTLLRSGEPSTFHFIFLSNHVLACSGGAHSGGTVQSEPFHITFKAVRKDKSLVSTINPHTNLPTVRHHFYIAENKNHLKRMADAWAAKQAAEQAGNSD